LYHRDRAKITKSKKFQVLHAKNGIYCEDEQLTTLFLDSVASIAMNAGPKMMKVSSSTSHTICDEIAQLTLEAYMPTRFAGARATFN
jgi:hypothetical protein